MRFLEAHPTSPIFIAIYCGEVGECGCQTFRRKPTAQAFRKETLGRTSQTPGRVIVGPVPKMRYYFDLHECAGVNMYNRILLAYDGSVEGRTALREGALLAKQCGAQVFLLSVLTEAGTLLLSEVTLAVATAEMEEDFQEILKEGVTRLKKLGFDPVAELVRGQPAEEIGKFAKKVGADLIVVGHRRQSAFDRWWSGPKGAYLMDHTDCSLLVARNAVSDEAIEKLLSQGNPD